MPDEVQVPNLSDIEIVKDGKRIDTSAIDDYDSFMAFLMQASIAANTVKIRKYYDDRKSKGRILNLPLSITQNIEEIRCPYPC